jgi:hypothetical protein
MSVQYELTSLRWGTPKGVSDEEEAPGMSEEEEPAPISPPSRGREEEYCGCG